VSSFFFNFSSCLIGVTSLYEERGKQKGLSCPKVDDLTIASLIKRIILIFALDLRETAVSIDFPWRSSFPRSIQSRLQSKKKNYIEGISLYNIIQSSLFFFLIEIDFIGLCLISFPIGGTNEANQGDLKRPEKEKVKN
jgi:hypothetical protein